MGAFQAKYTKAQREAVIRAVIADGLTYGEASRRAARGELEGAGRFDISANYVGKLVRPVQQRHEPERLTKEPEAREAIDTARARALVVILSELEAWEKSAARGEVDWRKHRFIMRALAEHGRTPGAKPQPGQSGQPEAQDTHTDAGTILAALADAARSNAEARSNADDEMRLPSSAE